MEDFTVIKVPYYVYQFKDVPKNIFSTMLFCYLGYINEEQYEKYLQIFFTKLKEVNPNKVVLDYNPHEKFPDNIDIPVNAYLFTLGNGEFQREENKVTDLFENIKEIISEKENIHFYSFLADFFNLSIVIYDSVETLFKNPSYFRNYKNSNKEVYLLKIKNDFFPILVQEIDGAIRLKSKFLV